MKLIVLNKSNKIKASLELSLYLVYATFAAVFKFFRLTWARMELTILTEESEHSNTKFDLLLHIPSKV